MATIKADRKKTTALLKKYFLERFNIKCSIRSDVYSGGSSLNISYDLGTSYKEIEKIAKQLEQGSFNGMEDIYEYDREKTPFIIEGHELETFKYVFVSQTIPDSIKIQQAKALYNYYNYEGVHPVETSEDLHKNFDSETFQKLGCCWAWSDVVYRFTHVLNFVTQDPEKIKILRAERKNDIEGYYYEFDGKEYHTSELIVIKEEQTPRPEAVPVESGKVQIIDYSAKAFAVVGDTRPIKDKLKELGGSFNARLTCGAGWIFSKSKLEAVKMAFSA